MDFNKMNAKHMTDTYDAVRRRIGRWSISEREKCEALWLWQRYKDYIISWRNYISHIRYIHPLVHTNLNHQKNTHVTHVNIICINKKHKTHTLDNHTNIQIIICILYDWNDEYYRTKITNTVCN